MPVIESIPITRPKNSFAEKSRISIDVRSYNRDQADPKEIDRNLVGFVFKYIER